MSFLRSKFCTNHTQNHSSKIIRADTDIIEPQISDDDSAVVDSIAPENIGSIPLGVLASIKDSDAHVSPSHSTLGKHKTSSVSRDSLDLESGLVTKQRHPASLPGDSTSLHAANTEPAMEHTYPSELSESANKSDVKPSSGKRTTRSQARRQSRADSHDSSSETSSEIPNTVYKIAKNNESGMAGTFTTRTSEKMLDIPRSLVIRKKDSSRTPSPLSLLNEDVQQLPPRSPARDDDAPEFSSPQSPILVPKPLRTLISSTSSNRSASRNKDQPPRGATMKERLAFARTRAPSPPLDDESKKVAVRPPMYDVGKGLCQWTSDLPSTSRPDRVWEWPKRWTCCRCKATTIVEQKICSNMSCSHYRCPKDCRMIRVPRPLGQFVGFGGS